MPPGNRGLVQGSARQTPRILLVVTVALLLARVALGVYEYAVTPNQTHEDRINWIEIERASELARAEGKPIFYDFTAAWCPPCQLMEREVFANQESAEWINDNFVPVQVMDRMYEDGKNQALVDSLQSKYYVRSFPTLVVTDAAHTGNRQTTGFGGRREMLDWLTEQAKNFTDYPVSNTPGVRN